MNDDHALIANNLMLFSNKMGYTGKAQIPYHDHTVQYITKFTLSIALMFF